MNFITSLLAALSLLATVAHAQSPTLPDGQYQADVPLGPALLAGRYSCSLAGEEAGFLKVSTSSAGALAGSITLLGRSQEFVGTVRSLPTGLRVMLRGKVREGAVLVKATLAGSELVGTATIRGKKAPCTIDLTGVAPLRARCLLTLTTNAKGVVTGTGTAKIGQTQIPVKAAGRLTRGKLTLMLKDGKKVLLRVNTGELEAAGFTATKWTGQSFGALTKGINLRFTPAPP